jgi:hypothetical protein
VLKARHESELAKRKLREANEEYEQLYQQA